MKKCGEQNDGGEVAERTESYHQPLRLLVHYFWTRPVNLSVRTVMDFNNIKIIKARNISSKRFADRIRFLNTSGKSHTSDLLIHWIQIFLKSAIFFFKIFLNCPMTSEESKTKQKTRGAHQNLFHFGLDNTPN